MNRSHPFYKEYVDRQGDISFPAFILLNTFTRFSINLYSGFKTLFLNILRNCEITGRKKRPRFLDGVIHSVNMNSLAQVSQNAVS